MSKSDSPVTDNTTIIYDVHSNIKKWNSSIICGFIKRKAGHVPLSVINFVIF